MSKATKLVIKLAVTVTLIVLVVRSSDFDIVIDRLLTVDLATLALAVILTLALSFVHVIRWTAVIEATGNKLGFLKTLQIVMIGYFFNQALPSSLGGDAVRAWCVYREGFGLSAAVNTVILDRLVALAALLLMAAVALPWLAGQIHNTAALWALPSIVIAGLASFVTLAIFDRLPISFHRWRLTRAAAHLSASTRMLFLHARYSMPALTMSIAIHLGVAVVVFVIAQLIDGHIRLLDCILLVPPVMLVTALPVSVAGWGVREGAMVVAFGFIGVAPSDAFAISLLFGIVVMLASLPGGIVWLLIRHNKEQPTSIMNL